MAENKKVKVGVFGAGRGGTMMKYCSYADNAELVAICDWDEPSLHNHDDKNVALYTDFDEFLKHDGLDAVVLANYANEHAPYAMKAMRAGKHVISEVLPFKHIKEGIELMETIEETGMIYAYAENYCYMPAPHEIRELFTNGTLGEFEYAEGEYMHNCEDIWDRITYGIPEHWRNTMSAAYYCTHSIGPMIHIANAVGHKPVKVTGFEGPYTSRMARMGALAGHMAMIVVTLENGAILKSIHGVGPSAHSIWYSCYGANGRAESGRDGTGCGTDTVYLALDGKEVEKYQPKDPLAEHAAQFGHGGSDFFTMYNFCEKILGREAEIIDIYETCDMFVPGLLAYESILEGGMPKDVPNFRNKEERDAYRNNTACPFPEFAGDMLQPSYSKGNPDVDPAIYAAQKEQYGRDRKYRH